MDKLTESTMASRAWNGMDLCSKSVFKSWTCAFWRPLLRKAETDPKKETMPPYAHVVSWKQ